MNINLSKNPNEALERASNLVGTKTGIIQSILTYLPDRADPAICYSTTIESDLSVVTGTEVGSLDAGGSSLQFAESLLSSLGESAERYCLYFPDQSALLETSYNELVRTNRSVVDFELLSLYDKSQYEVVNLTPIRRRTKIRWQSAVNLLSGEVVWIPAQRVWMGLSSSEPRYYPTTSNGCAAGPTMEDAVIGGITEFIERDAIMRTWYRQTQPRRLDVAEFPRIQSLVSDRFQNNFLTVHLFEIESQMNIPTIGCAIVDRRNRAPKFVLSGASSRDLETAVVDAVLEAAQSWVYVKELCASEMGNVPIDPTSIFNLRDNLLHYAKPEWFSDVEFLLGTTSRNSQSTVKSEYPDNNGEGLEWYLDALRAANLTPLVVDLTTPDIRDLGLAVTRIIIPELIGLALPSLPPAQHPAFRDHSLTDKPHPYP